MATPTEGAASDQTQIVVDWVALSSDADTGGSAVIAYQLQWHEGNSDVDATWTDLLPRSAYSTATSFTVTDGLVSGYSYSFRVRAVNFWGEGQYSSTKVIVASTTPDTALTPTTSIDTATGDLVISWSDPDDRGGAITQYLIEIRDEADTQWLESSSCAGTNAAVKAARQC